MNVHLVILGSGTSVPDSVRRPPAFLLQAGSLALLVDCGAGATTSLAAAGVTLDRLTGVLLTHLHPDHTAELVPLLFALHNPVGPRRQTDLPIWGPSGIREHLRALRVPYGDWVVPRGARVVPRTLHDRRPLRIEGAQVRPFAVVHSGPAFAYRVQLAHKTICFSGDSGPCDALVEAARDVDLFVCECSALECERSAGHLSPTDVGRIAAAAGCRTVVLTHLYQSVLASDPLRRVRAAFSGRVLLGADGLHLIGR